MILPLRSLLSAGSLFVLTSGGFQSPQFAPEDGTVLEKRFELATEIALDEFSMLVNGEDMSGSVPIPDVEMAGGVTLRVTDEYESVSDGRPARLRRVFEEFLAEYETPEDEGSENADDVEGAEVVFTWDEENEEYEVVFGDDSASDDEELLVGLVEDMDFRALLASDDVEEGDSWEVASERSVGLLFPGFDFAAGLSLAQAEADGEEAEILEKIQEEIASLPDNMSFTCTHKGMRTEGEVEMAVIGVELEGDGSFDLSEIILDIVSAEMGGASPEVQAATINVTVEGDGELLWNVAAGHFESYRLETDVDIELDAEMSVDAEGQSFTLEAGVLFAGELNWDASIVR